jgi:hypothetical protein
MDNLTTLNGLDNIESIGTDNVGHSIWLEGNPMLTSSTALSNAAGTFTSNALYVVSNPELACVPNQWAVTDYCGDTIRNGKALHDPCLYSCNSATGTCEQGAAGIASESSCANLCATPYKCSNHECVPTVGGGSKESCEAVCK